MRKSARNFRRALGIALLFSVAGCTTMQNWLDDLKQDDTGPEVVTNETTAPYIRDMYRLTSGDPATQADIYADASAAATLTPDPASRLRFALVLATPGHAGSDAERAQNMLRELLSQTALLTPTERFLATIHLHAVEERLVLDAEARRLRSRQSRAERTEDAAVARRIETVEEENRQLRQSLAEAEEKLEAITTIERSIREQTDNNLP